MCYNAFSETWLIGIYLYSKREENSMLNQGHSDFTYWKHSWHKWGILVAAILQLLALWMNIREYSNISRIGILSTVEWTSYASQKYWQCAINIVLIICFLGTFLIGAFARSRKGARLGEAFLLLLLAFAWRMAGFVLHPLSSSGKGLFWIFILFMAFGGAAHAFLQYRKK